MGDLTTQNLFKIPADLEEKTSFTAEDFMRSYEYGYQQGYKSALAEVTKQQKDLMKKIYEADLKFVQESASGFIPYFQNETKTDIKASHFRITAYKVFDVLYAIDKKHLLKKYRKVYSILDQYFSKLEDNSNEVTLKAAFLPINNLNKQILMADGYIWEYVKRKTRSR
ncbi:MAG: hypothetical protein JW928_08530 [Candidatus Aureabacteria bacterium]|nr:hypothetical protein [Candidatus Auribacterota bacterium]